MSNSHDATTERFIAFVVPVRPLRGLSIAEDVLALLSSTIRSVIAQSDPNWRLLLISSEELELNVSDERIINIIAADGLKRVASNTEEAYGDMHLKRFVGSRQALKIGASHIMFLDADDLINRHITEYVNRHGCHRSYLGSKGWEVMGKMRRAFYRRSRFAARCGTCAIVSRQLMSSEKFCGSTNVDIGRFYHHTFIASLLDAGASELPFPMAVYRTDHSANFTFGKKDIGGLFGIVRNGPFIVRRFLKVVRSVPYGDNLRHEFGDLECSQCVTLKN